MGKTIPVEVRQRIIDAIDQGYTHEEVAELFRVGTASIARFVARLRDTGSLETSPRPGRTPVLDEQAEAQVRGWVREQSDLTLGELRERLETAGYPVGVSAVCGALRRIGLVRKKRPCAPSSETAPMCGPRGRRGRVS